MKTKKIPTEIYSRVVGYYRPVHQWNNGKKAEFEERKEFNANSVSAMDSTKVAAI
jgi:hypothetical protein